MKFPIICKSSGPGAAFLFFQYGYWFRIPELDGVPIWDIKPEMSFAVSMGLVNIYLQG